MKYPGNPLRAAILAPLLFGILPILALYNGNKSYFGIDVLGIPLLAAFSLSVVISGLFLLLTGDRYKSCVLSSVFTLLFFSYGRITNLFEGVYYKIGTTEIGANKIVMTAVILVLFLTTVFIVFSSRKWKGLSVFLFICSSCAVFLTIIPIAFSLCFHWGKDVKPATLLDRTLQKKDARQLPDIYYIILDAYAREDILQSRYSYNDTILVPFLKSKGFFVADHAAPNYGQTVLSLASSLNLSYLDEKAAEVGVTNNDIRPLRNMIWNNRVFATLKKHGYTTVSFGTGYWPTNIKNTNLFLSTRWDVDDFTNGLLTRTPIPAFLQKIQFNQADMHRKRIKFTFDRLSKLPNNANHPFIAFAHIVSPHPPFLFRGDGSEIDSRHAFSFWDGGYEKSEYRRLYAKQVTYISKRIVGVVDSILQKSARPPIIIIQGDHGPGSGLVHNDPDKTDMPERMSILNALYIPPACSTWQEMSPVNTFRIIFNNLFDTKLPLLHDKSCFSTWKEPYRFINVTERLKTEEARPWVDSATVVNSEPARQIEGGD